MALPPLAKAVSGRAHSLTTAERGVLPALTVTAWQERRSIGRDGPDLPAMARLRLVEHSKPGAPAEQEWVPPEPAKPVRGDSPLHRAAAAMVENAPLAVPAQAQEEAEASRRGLLPLELESRPQRWMCSPAVWRSRAEPAQPGAGGPASVRVTEIVAGRRRPGTMRPGILRALGPPH
ncbi:MAG: hypothetical protein ACJ74Y_16360 [Bryobacteraceae bacterium]